jgi:hypothetical protein
MHDPIFLIMVVLIVALLLVCFHIPATGFRDPVACMSPLTSRAASGRFVPIPTLEVVVSTKRLAVPISRLEVTVVFPETVSSPPTTTLAVVAKPVVTLLDEMVWGVVLLPLLVTEARVVVVSNSMFPTENVCPTSTLLILIVEFFTCKILSADSIDI